MHCIISTVVVAFEIKLSYLKHWNEGERSFHLLALHDQQCTGFQLVRPTGIQTGEKWTHFTTALQMFSRGDIPEPCQLVTDVCLFV